MPAPLTAATLLDAWEAGRVERIEDRAPSLLSSVGWLEPGEEVELTVGQCDRLLVELRAALFGTELDIVTTCPSCGDLVEFELDADQVRGADPPVGAPPVVLTHGGVRAAFRLPTNRDVRAVADLADGGDDGGGEAAARSLVRQCLQEARDEHGPVAGAEALEPLLASSTDVLEHLAAVDAAVTAITVNCSCGHEWADEFDIRTFLWGEVSEWAQRVLLEVHELASAYGWSERDILALSPWRRQAYPEVAVG